MAKTQFPPEAVWIATGKALVAKHKGNGILAEGQITDRDGNAWTATIDPRTANIKLSCKENWNEGNPKCTHWIIPLEAFDRLTISADLYEIANATDIASPLYLYRTHDGLETQKDFRGEPPRTVVEGFEQTERTYQLVGPA